MGSGVSRTIRTMLGTLFWCAYPPASIIELLLVWVWIWAWVRRARVGLGVRIVGDGADGE